MVQTSGGLQLFNVVVRDRHVAMDIIQHIKNNSEGSTTLIPLADIRDRGFSRPPLRSLHHKKAKYLTDVIKCSEEVMPAVHQLFGRYVLVEDKELTTEFQKHGLDCITLDGDMVSPLKGGRHYSTPSITHGLIFLLFALITRGFCFCSFTGIKKRYFKRRLPQ